MSAFGVIFARGGSKGIPNKNLQDVAGLTLLERAIRTAQSLPELDRIVVSTDSPEIAEVARVAGAEVPFMRPTNLAADDSPEWGAWQHAVYFFAEEERLAPEIMVSIPTTSPLRQPEDVRSCIDYFQNGDWDAVLTVTPAQRNPYFNMVGMEVSGQVSLLMQPHVHPTRRQDAPSVFDICTLAYVLNTEFVRNSPSLWNGRVGAVVVPQERALDIDSLFDLELARLMLSSINEHIGNVT